MRFACRLCAIRLQSGGTLHLDALSLTVSGGTGGSGFPANGGIGGNGGSVYLRAAKNLALSQVVRRNPSLKFRATDGRGASKVIGTGAAGRGLTIPVPLGVSVYDTLSGRLIADLNKESKRILVAAGGEGGSPATDFKPGKPQRRVIELELKLIADVALVGFPNAGKSTFLKAVSRTNPKIADYPFTTLRPQVGVMQYDDGRKITVADLPGLIEGAHQNVGLGHKFLRHVERTKVMCFMIDLGGFKLNATSPFRSAWETLAILVKEIENYDESLMDKPAVLCLNKMDLPGANETSIDIENRLNNPDQHEALSNIASELRPSRMLPFRKVYKLSTLYSTTIEPVRNALRCEIDDIFTERLMNKICMYRSMRWKKFDFANAKWAVCAAEFGGPIAVYERSSLEGRQCSVHIFTGSGQQTGTAQWSSGPIVHICFTRQEELLIVGVDGKCQGYDMFGTKVDTLQFSMGLEAQELKVHSARDFVNLAGGTGLAVLTNMNRLFVVNNAHDPKLWRNRGHLPAKCGPPDCWTVLVENRAVKIYFVLKNEIHVLSQAEMETIIPAVGRQVQSFVDISLSPANKHCALLSDNAYLFILTADLKNCLCESSLGSIDAEIKLLWCGEWACCVHRPSFLTLDLCTIEAGRLPIPLQSDAGGAHVHAVQDLHGIRVICDGGVEFVEPVPDSVRAIHQIGSTAPGALLLRAFQQHSANDYRSYSTLKLIEDECELAVRQCFEAAGRQWSVDAQKILMAAASLGKSFVPSMDPSGYVNMLRVLRVLNNIRHPNFGISITYAQLEDLSIAVLVDRIINRKQWPLAQLVCNHLKLPVGLIGSNQTNVNMMVTLGALSSDK